MVLGSGNWGLRYSLVYNYIIACVVATHNIGGCSSGDIGLGLLLDSGISSVASCGCAIVVAVGVSGGAGGDSHGCSNIGGILDLIGLASVAGCVVSSWCVCAE